MSEQLSPAEQMARYAEEHGLTVAPPTITSTDPFFYYDRPEEFGVHVESVRVPMRDGVELAGELHRPAGPDGLPAPGIFPGIVLEFNGYGAVSMMGKGAQPYVTRGYVVLLCSVRGSGDSPGEIDPFSAQEQRDDVDIIEWLAARPFCTGRIGQMGVSYGGHNSMLAAVNDAPHLVTVIAIQAFSDWYENTIYRGGVPNATIREWQQATAPATLETYPQHPLFDDFWRERSVKERWDAFTVPALLVGGWEDPYRGGMAESAEALGDRAWTIAGPWSHGMVPGQQEDIGAAGYLAWWDHWLSEDHQGALPATRGTSYEMPAGGWVNFSQWPPTEARQSVWELGADGAVSTGSACEQGARDFPAIGGRLTFDSASLERDLVIAGSIRADITASFEAADGVVAVIVEDVAPDGTSSRIGNGWLRASHREGHAALAPVEPGTSYPLSIQLWPMHHRLGAGHALRVVLASEDYPLIDRVAEDGAVTVACGDGASVLHIPIID